MKKILGSVIFASILSANSFAGEIYKGNLVNHKEISSGSFVVHFKPLDVTKKSHFGKLISHDPTNINTSTIVQHSAGTTSTPIQINGAANGYIYNKTQSEQEYTYVVEVCIALNEDDDQCNEYSNVIDLQPGGHFISSENPSFVMNLDHVGSFSTSVSTEIISADGITDVGATSYGTVDVSASK